MPRPTTVVLIDGNNLAHRALHAYPDTMSTSDGRKTGAVKGMLNMLREARFRHQATHWVVAWDSYTDNRRKAIYPEYKANRKRDPGARTIGDQWPLIHQMVDLLAIPSLCVDGYEADDIIAAAVAAFRDQLDPGGRVIIESNDKDLMQLVGGPVYQAVADKTIVGVDSVVARHGVPPAQLGEKLAISGDKIDNIPGVPGVGDTIASAWLRDHGSSDGIRAAISAGVLKGKRADAFANAYDSGALSLFRRLVDLDTSVADALGPMTLPSVRVARPDYARLVEFYTLLEFRQELDDLFDLPAYQRFVRGAP